jgi:quaternary ammonium compound-resistance protein SugE
MTSALTIKVVAMVGLVAITQVAGSSMLAKSDGFHDPVWTGASLATYLLSFYVLALVIRDGMALSLVMPVLAAIVPLATIAVAVIVLKEQASVLRLGLLSTACLLIGAAATV